METILSKFKKIDFKIKRLLSNSNYSGNFRSIFRGKGLEWSEFKEYDQGEDAGRIDWLISEREQRLLTKKFEEEKEAKIYFLLDMSDSMNFGFEKKKIDTLLETFLYLSISGIENQDKIGGVILKGNESIFLKETKTKAGVFNFYKLCLINNGNEKSKKDKPNYNSIINGLEILNKIKIRNSIVFIISDKQDSQIIDSLKILSIKNKCFYINIFDSFENTLETSSKNSGILGFLGLNKENIFINNIDSDKKLNYKNERKKETLFFSSLLNKIGVKYLLIDEKTLIFNELVKFLNK